MEMKKLARLTLLLTLALVLSLVENIIPIFNGFIIPGLKLGLANIVILFILYSYGIKEALFISLLRVLVISILQTGLFNITFFFSISGAIVSLLIMYLSKKFFPFSVIGVSVLGSIGHSIGQFLVASILLNNATLMFYLPFVLVFSILAGIIIGLLSKKLLNYVDLSI